MEFFKYVLRFPFLVDTAIIIIVDIAWLEYYWIRLDWSFNVTFVIIIIIVFVFVVVYCYIINGREMEGKKKGARWRKTRRGTTTPGS